MSATYTVALEPLKQINYAQKLTCSNTRHTFRSRSKEGKERITTRSHRRRVTVPLQHLQGGDIMFG